MLSRASSTLVRSSARSLLRSKTATRVQQTARRNMAGGGISRETHAAVGEAFGFVCWIWVFHRASQDLPVVLGWRHPWEHGPDHGPHYLVQIANEEELKSEWDAFYSKSVRPGEDDDDDDDDEDDDEDEDE